MLLCRGAAPPLPVIGSTPDDTLLAVLDPLLAPSDTGAVADGRIPSLGRQMPDRRLQRVAGAFRADRPPHQPHVCRANPEPVFGPMQRLRGSGITSGCHFEGIPLPLRAERELDQGEEPRRAGQSRAEAEEDWSGTAQW